MVLMPREGEQLAAAGRVPDLALPSALPVASRVPSGDQDTELTALGCPLRVRISRPPAASQTLAVPSALPVASRAPSGDQDTERTSER
jgi:hypothetical protein